MIAVLGIGAALPVCTWLVMTASSEPVPVWTEDATAADRVRSFDDALNRHDVPKAMEFVADGATVQQRDRAQTRGQIRGWIRELVRQNVHLELIGDPTLSSAPARSGTAEV